MKKGSEEVRGVPGGENPMMVVIVDAPNAGFWGPEYNTPECGDGLTHLSEECDDGNVVGGDGCSEACKCEGLGVCDVTVGPDVVLSSLVTFARPNTTIHLLPGIYSQPHHCYFVVNQTGLLLEGLSQEGVVFDCSDCAGAAIVLVVDGTILRNIFFRGLSLMGANNAVEAKLDRCSVSGSKRSHFDAAGSYLIDLQAGLHITGTNPMRITLSACTVAENEGGGIYFNVPGGQLDLVDCEAFFCK